MAMVIWVCDDCLFLNANGEMPEDAYTADGELTERGQALHNSEANRIGSTIGAGHEDCDHADDDDSVRDCETIDFAIRRCESCGDGDAGRRRAMTVGWE
jgi:hypothetical protein